MDDQKPRRRRAQTERTERFPEETNSTLEKTGMENRCSIPHHSKKAPPAQKKSKYRRSHPFTIAIAIIEGLLIAILVLAIWLFSLNGWTDQGMIGFVKGIITTPTPIPTPTYSPAPTPSPTPLVEYVYITPQPTNTPSPTPIPPVISTDAVEQIHITPAPAEALILEYSEVENEDISAEDFMQFFWDNDTIRLKKELRSLFREEEASVLERIFTLHCKHLIRILELENPTKICSEDINVGEYTEMVASVQTLGEMAPNISQVGKMKGDIENMTFLLNLAANATVDVLNLEDWQGERIKEKINLYHSVYDDLFEKKTDSDVNQSSRIGTMRNDIEFGMTMAEVEMRETAKLLGMLDNTLQYSTFISSNDCTLLYTFFEGQLGQVSLHFNEYYTSTNRYVMEYKGIAKELCSKYGYRETQYVWIDEFYKGNELDYGIAVIRGDLSLITEWDFDDATISFVLTGNNYEASQAIVYTSKEYTSDASVSAQSL